MDEAQVGTGSPRPLKRPLDRRKRRWALAPRAAVLAAALALAGTAPAAGSVYVANDGSSDVSQYDVGPGGALTAKDPATVGAGSTPFAIAVSPDGGSVYVANFNSHNVAQYDVGPGGALFPKDPATIGAGLSPAGIAVSPDGANVYVANFNSQDLAQYDVGPGGALALKVPATVGAGTDPLGIAVSPDGGSVYVANWGSNNVSQYDVGPGGALFAKDPATVGAGTTPFAIAVSPDGGSVYVANDSSSDVSQYDVGPGGALTAKDPATVGAGTSPRGIAVSPDGKSVYAANFFSNNISQYDVGPGGALFAKDPATVAAGDSPRGIVVSPDGGSAYAANDGSDNLSRYDIGPGGALAAVATVPSGSGPGAIAVSPNQPPVASLAAPSQAMAGSPVAFDASASEARGGEIASYRFDFGDGTVAEGASPTRNHTYSVPGTYEATVTVDDGVGCPEPAFTGLASLFTGQTAYCNGPSVASSQAHTIEVNEPEDPFSLNLALKRPRLPLRRVRLKATCLGSDCELSASAAVKVRTGSGKHRARSFSLRPASRALFADAPVKLALRVPARARRAARSGLRQGRRVTVVAHARATSADRERGRVSRARLRR